MSDGNIISIGECMIELARGGDGRYGLAYGGDTFNTAVYMARAGAKVSYATRLGDDPYSDGIIALAKSENVDTSLIARAAGRNAGLYMIETTDERRTQLSTIGATALRRAIYSMAPMPMPSLPRWLRRASFIFPASHCHSMTTWRSTGLPRRCKRREARVR